MMDSENKVDWHVVDTEEKRLEVLSDLDLNLEDIKEICDNIIELSAPDQFVDSCKIEDIEEAIEMTSNIVQALEYITNKIS